MTPEQEEQVRRALAAAARAEDQAAAGPGASDRTEPGEQPGEQPGRQGARLPEDVAARLDSVLEELVAPRVASADPAQEDELARRRRRRWPNGLVAAAALVVIALAGGAVATDGFGLADGSGSDSRTAGSSTSDAARDSGAAAGADSPSTQPRELAAGGWSPTFRTETLARDLQRLLDRPGPLPLGEPPAWRCDPPPLRAGEQLVGVRLDGRRSSLVLGAPAAGERSARIYSCADPGTLVAHAIVHVPIR